MKLSRMFKHFDEEYSIPMHIDHASAVVSKIISENRGFTLVSVDSRREHFFIVTRAPLVFFGEKIWIDLTPPAGDYFSRETCLHLVIRKGHSGPRIPHPRKFKKLSRSIVDALGGKVNHCTHS